MDRNGKMLEIKVSDRDLDFYVEAMEKLLLCFLYFKELNMEEWPKMMLFQVHKIETELKDRINC